MISSLPPNPALKQRRYRGAEIEVKLTLDNTNDRMNIVLTQKSPMGYHGALACEQKGSVYRLDIIRRTNT